VERAISDEEIVERVRSGETPLFEMLVRRHNQRLYRVARSVLRDEHEAEDVMQHAYVSAYEHLHQFAGRASFATWLTRIAVHEALSRARRRGRLTGLESTSEEGAPPGPPRDERPDPEQQAQAAELRRLLEAAIDGLPGMYRTAFVLREVEGLGTPEVAECLEVSEDVVRTRVHRARALLRRSLYARTGATSGSAFQFHLTRCDRVVAGVFARLDSDAAALSPPTTGDAR
jgi:RNA polymerase sigma-70 factor, ECF subfamily